MTISTHTFATFHVDADSTERWNAIETFETIEEAEEAADRGEDGELYAAEIDEVELFGDDEQDEAEDYDLADAFA